MRWPDIFFKPKKRTGNVPMQPTPEAEIPAPVMSESGGDTRKLQISQVVLPPAPIHPLAGDSEVIKDMAEADTLRQLSRSGGVRLIKRDFFSTAPSPDAVPDSGAPAPTPIAAEMEQQESVETSATPRAPFSINLAGRHDTPPPGTVIFRRRTKMADVARIVLPPRREEPPTTSSAPLADTSPLPLPAQLPPATPPPITEPTSTIFPASFPVSMPAGGVLKSQESSRLEEDPVLEEKEAKPSPVGDDEAWRDPVPEAEKSTAVEANGAKEESFVQSSEEQSVERGNTNSDHEAESKSDLLSAPGDPERKEFILSNGERILGHILSETTDCIYVNHATLGVLTIPRAQIAQRPVEIILMNGDRIVGDILAETAESLFVRHASLGVLTVPKNQRSTRVVEAILKDGDRILGEVLGETGNFTVIRSATLGTVAVPHNRVAMLNRRAEEVQMKALPLADKPQA